MTDNVSVKPTRHVMALCREMFDRRAKYGANYPKSWREASRKKLEDAGLVEQKSYDPKYGEMYYFTEEGLSWYLAQSGKR